MGAHNRAEPRCTCLSRCEACCRDPGPAKVDRSILASERKYQAVVGFPYPDRKVDSSDCRLVGGGRRSGRCDGAGGAGDVGIALPDDASGEHAALDLAAVVALEKPASDGRVARGQRTRRSVGEALMELLQAGDLDPTAKAVAKRAGVSLRLVFHHFADMDDLYQFVAALQLRRQWADMPELSPKLSLSTRIERTVAHRAAFFEEIAQVRRALVRRALVSDGVRQAVARRPTACSSRTSRPPSPPSWPDCPAWRGRSTSVRWTRAPRGKPGSGCARRREPRCAAPGG